jgi:hypothetical protein
MSRKCGILDMLQSYKPPHPVTVIYFFDKATEEWRKLHNEIGDLYSSPSIIRIIKSRRMRWVGHVARMGRREMHIDY